MNDSKVSDVVPKTDSRKIFNTISIMRSVTAKEAYKKMA